MEIVIRGSIIRVGNSLWEGQEILSEILNVSNFQTKNQKKMNHLTKKLSLFYF